MQTSFSLDHGDVGPDELASRFDDALDAISDELSDAAVDIEARIRGSADAKAPVDTGRLRASIEGLIEEIAETIINVRVGTPVEYAEFQEFGTELVSAQPYLRPALEENLDWIVERVNQAVENGFSEAGFDV